jgi:hypothetical protein
MNDEELVEIPKSQFEFLVLKANIELLQRVNYLIDMIEEQIEKVKE